MMKRRQRAADPHDQGSDLGERLASGCLMKRLAFEVLSREEGRGTMWLISWYPTEIEDLGKTRMTESGQHLELTTERPGKLVIITVKCFEREWKARGESILHQKDLSTSASSERTDDVVATSELHSKMLVPFVPKLCQPRLHV